MADPRLIQALDYILNHSDVSSIEALAEAVVRRRRNLTIFNAIGDIPDPEQMAREVSANLGGSTKNIMEGMRNSIQEMIIRLVREHAPELTDSQIDELSRTWMGETKQKEELPPQVLLSMIEQFVSFSHGTMKKSLDENLREEMGAWPERYWNAFPPVVRQIISDYLKNKITEKEYKSKIVLVLG
ncbi:MAG: hypothetical protein FWD26_00845 [Treponema sp.]|nr:hypothetical protein [Treponema sp.]